MKQFLTSLIVLTIANTACGFQGTVTPTWTDDQDRPDLEHFPIEDPGRLQLRTPGNSNIRASDPLEVKAVKVAACKTGEDANDYFAYMARYGGPTLEHEAGYLKYLLSDPRASESFTEGFWRDALDAYKTIEEDAGMPGMKYVHAKGHHVCWSSKAIGYTCKVENRNYNDCDTAVRALQNTNCCKFKYEDGASSQYVHESCF